MRITRCYVSFRSDGIHQDELHLKKSDIQSFYEGKESVNEMFTKLHVAGNVITNLPDLEVEYIHFEIEDQRLPKNTELEVILNFEDGEINVGLLEYDNDPNIRLPIRELFVGNVYGEPLLDDGKWFFMKDLTELVDYYAKEKAKEIHEEQKKGTAK